MVIALANRIESIIEARQQIVTLAKAYREDLEKFRDSWYALMQGRQDVANVADRYLELPIQTALAFLSGEKLASIEARLQDHGRALDELIKRFSRKTLNIGTIGYPGQGKSQFAETLTGLKDLVISAKGENITGVCVIFQHDPYQKTPKAKVTYYQRSKLFEIIKRYFTELRLPARPKTIDDFCNMRDLPPLDLSKMGQESNEKYKYLQQYFHNRQKLLDELPADDQEREIDNITDLEEIQKYILLRRVSGGEAQQELYWNHLFVKKVEITCCFTNTNLATNVAFVDMPGFDTNRLGDQERFEAAIRQEIDLLLYIEAVGKGGRLGLDRQASLYDISSKNLRDIARKSSFLLINRWPEDSMLSCQNLASQQMKDQQGNNYFVDYKIADCRDERDVRAAMEDIIEILEQQMAGIDQQFYYGVKREIESTVQESLDALRASTSMITPARYISTIDEAAFNDQFNQVWEDLRGGFFELREKLKQQARRGVEKDLSDLVRKIITESTPDRDVPKHWATTVDDLSQSRDTVYEQTLKIVRTRLLGRFDKFEEEFYARANTVHSQVAQILWDKGRLKNWPNVSQHKLLDEIMATLDHEQHPSAKTIHRAFQRLDDFQITFDYAILPIIQRCLDPLKPGYISGSANASQFAEKVKELFVCLSEETQVAHDKIALREPSDVAISYDQYLNATQSLPKDLQTKSDMNNIATDFAQRLCGGSSSAQSKRQSQIMTFVEKLLVATAGANIAPWIAVGFGLLDVLTPQTDTYSKITKTLYSHVSSPNQAAGATSDTPAEGDVDEQGMLNRIKFLYTLAIHRINVNLSSILTEPYIRTYSFIETFVDLILNSEGAESVWRKVYHDPARYDAIWKIDVERQKALFNACSAWQSLTNTISATSGDLLRRGA